MTELPDILVYVFATSIIGLEPRVSLTGAHQGRMSEGGSSIAGVAKVCLQQPKGVTFSHLSAVPPALI